MAAEIVSRAQAKTQGLTHYFTGQPCKRGGVAMRKVANGDCQCAACLAAFKQHSNAWAQANPEKHREGAARRNKRWGEKNKDRRQEAGRRWRKERPHQVNAHTANRRALRKNATPAWFGELDRLAIVEAADLCRRRRAATGFSWHIDHMVPLAARKVCGLHCAENIQVIPEQMNLAKSNKLILTTPGEWIAHL